MSVEAQETSPPAWSVIYGIFDVRTGLPVYIGKTRNLRKRVECYRNPKQCHNKALARWLTDNMEHAVCVVVESGPTDPCAAERKWIERFEDRLFNLTNGSESNWRHASLPWMAGTGIKCPSDLLIARLSARRRDRGIIEQVKSLRKGMSLVDRCRFEVAVAMDHYGRYRTEIDRWLAVCQAKLVGTLEASECPS